MSSLLRALAVSLTVTAAAWAQQDAGGTFRRDLAALTSQPHRLAGSEQGLAASRYVQQRLTEIGLTEIYIQNFPVPFTRTLECTLEADGQTCPIYALLPNHLQPVVTPPEGITGRTVYAAGGRLEQYSGSPRAGVVVLDFSAGDQWLDAFGMGAKAVVFIGQDAPAPNTYHHQNFPANLPRFYVPAASAERLGLKTRARTITLRAASQWELRQGRNVIAILRGTGAKFEQGADEAIVLAAPLDSLSEVPLLSPGARNAANCAALLSLAEHLKGQPPRRDIVFCFFDGDAWDHAGAKAFYGALYRSKGKHTLAGSTLQERLQMLQSEQEYVGGVQEVLALGNIFSPQADRLSGQRAAEMMLRRETKTSGGSVRDELQLERTRRRGYEQAIRQLQARGPAATLPAEGEGTASGPSPQEIQRQIARLEQQIKEAEARIEPLTKQTERWSQLERGLYDRRYRQEYAEKYDLVLATAKDLCAQRRDELAMLVAHTEQGLKLFQAVGDGRSLIVLHLSINLADQSPRWTFVHGYDSLNVHNNPDRLGHYAGVFQGIRDVAAASGGAGGLPCFEPRTAEGLYNVRMFVPGLIAHSGAAAGIFGVSNLAVMTPMDRRPRDGQPCDLVSRPGPDGRPVAVLHADNMLAALGEIRPFLTKMGSDGAFSLTSGINPMAKYVEVSFSKGKYAGASGLMLSAGSAMADRPARGAFAIVTRRPSKVWEGARVDLSPPGFQPFAMARLDVNGRFELPPLSEEYYRYNVLVGAIFDPRGLIDFVSNTRTVFFGQPITNAATYLFRATGITLVGTGFDRGATASRALKAASTAPLSDDQSLVCESGNVLSVYALRGTELLKVFNPDGVVALGNAPPADPVLGLGLPAESYDHWPTAEITAHDLHALNNKRLGILRDNRILDESLDRLHGEAQDMREQAQAMPAEQVARRVPTLEGAAAVSRRAYKPLLSVLNDLVVAVVLLLLLSIPFAYSLERLLVGSPHIYRQIGWFAGFFLLTFAALYLVNPAFRIAATPIVIFLAFAIILLSTLVIVIMTRKLQAEVRRMQGLGTTVHASDVSRLGTMMAAVQMGISTMRRRPIRTLLTAVTVLLLTFTILTFASFSSSWGNRRSYVGPMSGPPRILVRHPLWSRISEQVPIMLTGLLGDGADVVPLYWVSQTAGEVQEFVAAGMTKEIMLGSADGGKIVALSALVGLDTRDVARLPELAEVLVGDRSLLDKDGVFLTAAVADHLGVKPGQAVNVDGAQCVLAGVIDLRKITGYRLLEGSSMLPVDYQASGGGNAQSFQAKESAALEDMPEMESAQFITFSADRTAIIPVGLARQLGGRVAGVSIYPKLGGPDPEQVAGRVATVTGLPSYVGARGGVYRLFFTTLTEASGWRDLVIPVFLGGLIIFATMLGSVSDREKEIYAFSALGLAPPHVASLFFAEAGVYAVVGGMGGYMLGQVVARALSFLSDNFGILTGLTMNYSSTNAIVTVLLVMCTVLVSTIYPAVKASRSANPGIQRHWRIGRPVGDVYDIVFPFTVSAYDIAGVGSFLKEHFENYSDTALGVFATAHVHLFRQHNSLLGIQAQVALAPFDLGVSQKFALLAQPSEIEGIEEIRILLRRLSGTQGDWQRANRVFINELRKQLLIWRAVTPEIMERYRQMTLGQWAALPVEDVRADTFGAGA